jgi:hypothetical protein
MLLFAKMVPSTKINNNTLLFYSSEILWIKRMKLKMSNSLEL